MRILLVEDEEKVARFVARGLKAERYAVDIASDGNAGLEYVRAYPYDLIVLDLNLPGIPGTELLTHIRKSHPNVPVLILTARDDISDKVANFEAGADDYLTKPFSFAELIVRVKALLRRGPVTTSTVLRVGELELDRVVHKVRRGNTSIELTAKEFSLLEYLMINARRTVTRSMIMENVWKSEYNANSNLVDVYIKYVRDKIDGDGSYPKLLRTMRGVGYVIADN